MLPRHHNDLAQRQRTARERSAPQPKLDPPGHEQRIAELAALYARHERRQRHAAWQTRGGAVRLFGRRVVVHCLRGRWYWRPPWIKHTQRGCEPFPSRVKAVRAAVVEMHAQA